MNEAWTGFAGQDAQARQGALGPEVAKRVVALTLKAPPSETTHWTAMMAKRPASASARSNAIWRAHGLRPHKIDSFSCQRSKFVDKTA